MKNSLKFLPILASALLLVAPVLRAADTVSGTSVQQADTPPPGEGGPRGPGGPGGRGGPGAMLEHAKKQLNLTADQEAKWKAIGEEEMKAMAAFREDKSLSREQKQAKRMELNKSFAEQRRAVLDATQQAKFDEMRAKMMERGPGQGGPGGKKKNKEN